MNALSKILTGAIVVSTALIVACGKKNSGANNGVSGVGCIQMGATCVAPGTPGFGGTFEGTIGSGAGGYFVKIKLRNAGYGGGGVWGGYGQMPNQAAQAIMEFSIRALTSQGGGWGWNQAPIPGRAASGRGLFVNNGAQIQGSDGFIYQVNGQFTANQMNVQITGGVQAAGVIYQVGQQYQGGGWGGGWGGGGYAGFDGGGGYSSWYTTISPAQAGYQPNGYWGF